MSREQRRQDRKAQTRGGGSRAAAPPNRRTPVKARGGTGLPWVPIAIAAGTFAIVLLIAYLILQARSDDSGVDAASEAEQDASTDLPGVFVPSQGRGHFSGSYTPDRPPHPFCEGVESSGEAAASPQASATSGTSPTAQATGADGTPLATSTPGPTNTPGGGLTTPTQVAEGSPQPTATPREDCYASNPPSSGRHLNVQRNADVGNGNLVNIPPDPDVYPSDVEIPRDAIPHILEHAGVFVGYNCAEGDQACQDVVDQLADVVNDRIDNHDDRVVMAADSDLPVGTIGLASWTRVMNVRYADFDKDAASDFIGTHSCRFDPEGFCG
jgi:hypothetical protein